MKHLRLFENRSQKIFIVRCDDIVFDAIELSSFTKTFFTKKDAENWFIVECNKIQDDIIDDDEDDYTVEQKKKYDKYILNNFKECQNFIYKVTGDYLSKYSDEDELEPYIEIYEDEILSVDIPDDIKIKWDAKKYNL
jgi:hypothetical protein